MTDSSMYASLFALVDSHLSKTSLQENGGNTNTTLLNLPSLSGRCNGNVSESLLSLNTQSNLPIPSFSSSESPIQTILAQQVANMLIAKEKQKEEEKQILEEKLKRVKIEDEKNSVIDLMKAIQMPYYPKPLSNKEDSLSRSSSVEFLLKSKILEEFNEKETKNISKQFLPCIQDMSYILKEKLETAKCSSFGKVLSKRWRPQPSPHLKKHLARIHSRIKRFNFSTPSPCDIIKSNLRKPTMSCTFALDITKFVEMN